MEKIIKFSDDEFKNACDENKVEEFKSKNFHGTEKFEITFKEWAEIEKDSQLYNGFEKTLKGTKEKIAKKFYIIDNKGNRISNKNTNYFPTKKDFDDIKLPNPFDKDSNFIMWSFYAVLFLWCVNISNDSNDNFIEYLNNIESTIEKNSNFFRTGDPKYNREITKGEVIHFGVSYNQLLPRTPYILQYLIKHNPDYANYKVIFTPNCPKSDKSNSTSNGGSNMSDTSKNTNIDIIKFVAGKIEKYNQIVFTGAPGTGKTYAVSEYVKGKPYEFVQFHPSYDYTDFVEGIRPMPNSNADDKNADDKNIFVRVEGIFKKFCRKIVEANNKAEDKENPPTYYFVIDEINRADLSRVFGELMFGLEESYRGEKNAFPTQYQNLPTFEYKKGEGTKKIENDVFENGFYVPENLKIIGMMNDIDRSVETFDFALRRRFVWIDIKANDVMLESVKSINGIIDEKSSDDVKKDVDKIIAMNKVISEGIGSSLGLNESYHIGPAFFKNLYDKDENGNIIKDENGNIVNNLETIFAEKIEPQLREYVRGRSTGKIKALIDKCKEALLSTGDSNG